MKTVELVVRFTAQVDDAVAVEIEKNSEMIYMNISLNDVRLAMSGSVGNKPIELASKFVEYETLDAEVVSDIWNDAIRNMSLN